MRKTNSFNPFRRNPMDLTEQLTLAEAKAGAGKPIERLSNLRDPKFRSMSKYEHAHDRSDGSKVVIHYVKDPFGKTTDFKFIDK
ncbi:MAG: hypothetical protein KDD53_01150 [Bdellovibrionales bacterium]|nr:hypothetical protein [Bdellovibrionales bacterium]